MPKQVPNVPIFNIFCKSHLFEFKIAVYLELEYSAILLNKVE